MIKKLIKYFSDPAYRFRVNAVHGIYFGLSDEEYIKKAYKVNFGKEPDLDNPVTFSEKLMWLKLYDRKPLYTKLVDKYAVREFVKEKIGEEHLIPLLGVWDSVKDIDFDKLPEQFVLKCTHDSGGVIICKDKSTADLDEIKRKLEKRYERDYYKYGREWPYKNVPRKIIAEEYMVDESGYELKDYKFFCFDGKAKVVAVYCDRAAETGFKCDFFDLDFKPLDFDISRPHSNKSYSKPTSFDEMIEIAQRLSSGLPHVRVDLYDINGKIYFGELTFFHGGGLKKFHPAEWDYIFGEWLRLPEKSEE